LLDGPKFLLDSYELGEAAGLTSSQWPSLACERRDNSATVEIGNKLGSNPYEIKQKKKEM
jgi:hypothetical protein